MATIELKRDHALGLKKAKVAAAWISMFCGIISWMGFIAYNYLSLADAHEDVLFSAAAFGFLISLLSYIAAALIIKPKTVLRPNPAF